MSDPKEISLGNHRIILQDDLVILRLQGIYMPDDFLAVTKHCYGLFDQYPQVYILVDISRLNTIPAETRTAWLAWIKGFDKKPPKVAIVGANFTMRTVITMMKALRRLMAPSTAPTPELFDTEAQALAYFDRFRRN